MKRLFLLIIFVLFLVSIGAYAQDDALFPKVLPDPAVSLNAPGELHIKNYSYNGKLFNGYLSGFHFLHSFAFLDF